MLFIADDLSGLAAALESASTAALVTDDTPVVLIIKDTQVSQALRGSPAERELREVLSNKVWVFVCETDLIRYGFRTGNVLGGISVVKAPERTPESEGTAQQVLEPRPLVRFLKQVEKVCEK